MIVRIGVIVLGMCAAAALATGCGDDDADTVEASSGIETSSLTKKQFVKRVNELCVKGNEKNLERLNAYMVKNEKRFDDPNELAAAAIRVTLLPEVEEQLGEIEEIGAPAGDEREVEKFIAAQRRSVASLERQGSIALETDIQPAFGPAGRLARQYGLVNCAYD